MGYIGKKDFPAHPVQTTGRDRRRVDRKAFHTVSPSPARDGVFVFEVKERTTARPSGGRGGTDEHQPDAQARESF
jgi:hypothetical protein